MQARLQEIRDRLGKIRPGEWSKYGISALINYGKKHCGMWDISERRDGETHVMPLYDEDADLIANSPADIKFLLDALDQSQEENKLLQRKFSNLNKIVDEYQNELIPNYRSRAEQSQDRERVLRDFIDAQFCQNFKKYGKSTMCHHPDNGLCDKYYDCKALNEALKEDKPND